MIVATAERGVEIDEVDPFGAVALPPAGGLERLPVRGLGAGRALHQSHRRTVLRSLP